MAVASEPADPRGAQVNQGVAAGLLLIGFVLNWAQVVPAVATVLLAGAVLGPRFGPVLAIYAEVIRHRLAPPATLEDPRPMRFNAGFEAVILAMSTGAFVEGYTDAGWGLALFTVVLAGLSACTDFCPACRVYSLVSRPRQAGGPVPAELAPPAALDGPPVERHHSYIRGWRARWVGVRTLGRWPRIVDETPDGQIVLSVGSEEFLLPPGDHRLWPVSTCKGCHRVWASVDVSRQHRQDFCYECMTEYRETTIRTDD